MSPARRCRTGAGADVGPGMSGPVPMWARLAPAPAPGATPGQRRPLAPAPLKPTTGDAGFGRPSSSSSSSPLSLQRPRRRWCCTDQRRPTPCPAWTGRPSAPLGPSWLRTTCSLAVVATQWSAAAKASVISQYPAPGTKLDGQIDGRGDRFSRPRARCRARPLHARPGPGHLRASVGPAAVGEGRPPHEHNGARGDRDLLVAPGPPGAPRYRGQVGDIRGQA